MNVMNDITVAINNEIKTSDETLSDDIWSSSKTTTSSSSIARRFAGGEHTSMPSMSLKTNWKKSKCKKTQYCDFKIRSFFEFFKINF